MSSNSSPISVILVFHNHEESLEAAASSALSQSVANLELVMIDDGSSDKSNEIAVGLIDIPRVRLLINKYNEGVGLSRNRGILASTAPIVAIQKPTEISLPDRLERQLSFLNESEDIVCVGMTTRYMTKRGKPIGYSRPADFEPDAIFHRATLTGRLSMFGSTVAFRRDRVIELGGYRPDLDHEDLLDTEIWLRAMSLGDRVANIDKSGFVVPSCPRIAPLPSSVFDELRGRFRRRNLSAGKLRADYFDIDGFSEFVPEDEREEGKDD